MNKIKLIIGHKYLYKEHSWSNIDEMKVVNITDTSMQLLFPSGIKGWVSKDEMDHYIIIEDITKFRR